LTLPKTAGAISTPQLFSAFSPLEPEVLIAEELSFENVKNENIQH
jgi:hypothetical protein